MATNPEKVMQFVKDELEKEPDASTADLFERAKSMDRGVRSLTLRQFNARFPLQIKRIQSQRSSKGRSNGGVPARRRRDASMADRDGVRKVFLQFAEDLASAEERSELVRVLAGVDKYVEAAIKESRPRGGRGRRR